MGRKIGNQSIKRATVVKPTMKCNPRLTIGISPFFACFFQKNTFLMVLLHCFHSSKVCKYFVAFKILLSKELSTLCLIAFFRDLPAMCPQGTGICISFALEDIFLASNLIINVIKAESKQTKKLSLLSTSKNRLIKQFIDYNRYCFFRFVVFILEIKFG